MEPITLDTRPLSDLVDAFNDAFSTYQVPVEMTEEKLRGMIRARSVDLSRSFGFADGGAIVAFLLNGSRVIDGTLTAYDSGTGVRQAYQHRGIGKRLLRHALASLEAVGYGGYVLEVLTENTNAIALYEQHGFRRVRTFHCYSGSPDYPSSDDQAVSVSPITDRWSERIEPMVQYHPSWQNAHEAIDALADECVLIEASGETGCVAYGVLEPKSGNLMQFGFDPSYAGRARAVLAAAARTAEVDEIRHLNVDAEAVAINEFLVDSGFRRIVSQFEMVFSWI